MSTTTQPNPQVTRAPRGQAPAYPPVPELPRKRFTRSDVERLLQTDIFEGQRYELIDGDLIDKMGQNPPHALSIQRLTAVLATLFAGCVRVQLPVELGGDDGERNLPEPDVTVLSQAKPDYGRRHPRGDELLLVVEVADTTAAFDLGRKAELYARANVPEYWVLDLNRQMLVVHRQTDGEQYRSIQMYAAGDEAGLEVPGKGAQPIQVSDILPPAD